MPVPTTEFWSKYVAAPWAFWIRAVELASTVCTKRGDSSLHAGQTYIVN